MSLFDFPEQRVVFIVHKNTNKTTVYYSHYSQNLDRRDVWVKSQISDEEIKYLLENNKSYLPVVFSFFHGEIDSSQLSPSNKVTLQQQKLLEVLLKSDKQDEESKDILKEMLANSVDDISLSFGYSHVEILAYVALLEKKLNIMFSDKDKSVVMRISLEYCQEHEQDILAATSNTLKLKEMVVGASLSAGKRFDFNDLDCQVWEQDGFIFGTTQSGCLILDIRDKDNFIIYYFEDENGNFDKLWSELAYEIESNSVSDFNVALEKRQGEYIRCNILNLKCWTYFVEDAIYSF